MDPIVWVNWRDSHQESTPWVDRSDVGADVALITTVGYLLSDNGEWVSLYQSTWHGRDDMPLQGVFHIPRGCIVSMGRLDD